MGGRAGVISGLEPGANLNSVISLLLGRKGCACACVYGVLPSLLVVTGMLWTVRSLKQELVRTWSSSELNTQDWRSAMTKTTIRG